MDYGTLGARGLQVAENGDLIAECAFVLAQFDPATGECKHLYDPEAFANSISYTTLQDTLAMTDGDIVTFYDLTTGEQTGSFSTAGQQPEDGGPKVATIAESASYERVLASDPENGAVYFADSTGVYRHLLDGAVTERLIDGELCSLNMPALRLTDLIVKEDGSLLLLYADGMDPDAHELHLFGGHPDGARQGVAGVLPAGQQDHPPGDGPLPAAEPRRARGL